MEWSEYLVINDIIQDTIMQLASSILTKIALFARYYSLEISHFIHIICMFWFLGDYSSVWENSFH